MTAYVTIPRPAADLRAGDRRLDFIPDLETRVRLDDDGLRARLFCRPAGSSERWAYHGTFKNELAAMTAADQINPSSSGSPSTTRST